MVNIGKRNGQCGWVKVQASKIPGQVNEKACWFYMLGFTSSFTWVLNPSILSENAVCDPPLYPDLHPSWDFDRLSIMSGGAVSTGL